MKAPAARVAESPPIAQATHVALEDLCPLEVPDSAVRAEDVEIGAALVFTTTGPYGGDVADLRRRVRHLADVHNHHRDWIAARMPDRAALLPPALRQIDDVPGGARIMFLPADPMEIDELRAHVHAEAKRLETGTCPIAMPQTPPHGAPTDTRVVRR